MLVKGAPLNVQKTAGLPVRKLGQGLRNNGFPAAERLREKKDTDRGDQNAGGQTYTKVTFLGAESCVGTCSQEEG